MLKNRAGVDAERIQKDARLVIAKYKAWLQTPEEERPKDIKDECVMKIYPGVQRWSTYFDALVAKAAKLGYEISSPSRVIDADDKTVLLCSVKMIPAPSLVAS